MKQRPLSDLQQRVLKAIGEDWTLLEHVHEGCSWGKKGCRRQPYALGLVLQALIARGVIESALKDDHQVFRRKISGGAA